MLSLEPWRAAAGILFPLVTRSRPDEHTTMLLASGVNSVSPHAAAHSRHSGGASADARGRFRSR